jgi:hypothetical protein
MPLADDYSQVIRLRIGDDSLEMTGEVEQPPVALSRPAWKRFGDRFRDWCACNVFAGYVCDC